MKYNIVAIVVTYNRLELLKECINAIKIQTLKVDSIFVVNNSSTDDTLSYLESVPDINHITIANNGCSWGISTAFQKLIQYFDYFWVMDDDTIPEPNCLEHLIKPTLLLELNGQKLGFIGSIINWIDNKPHKMNVQLIQSHVHNLPFTYYIKDHILLITCNSFVSVLFTKDAIIHCGLPIKEFFIWGDDQEYTSRMIKKGYLGLLSLNSIAIHKTKTNYDVNVYEDVISNLWKYKYGIRNLLYIKRKDNFFRYIFSLINHLSVYPIRVLIKRKSEKIEYSKTIFLTALKSIFFNPRIEYIKNAK